MTDFTTLSDDELMRMAGVGAGASAPASPTDFSKLSDDDLMRMAGVKKTDTSLTGALARGGEQSANALGALVSETGKHIGGGKQFPALMAKVAAYLHDPNYRSGMEDAADPNASLGDRAAGVGRAIVEGAPGMALSGVAGLAAGPAGFIGTQALLNSGNAIQGVRQADKVAPDQALDTSQLTRVGGATAIDTLLASLGAGKALEPVGKGAGSAIKGILGATGVGAAANAGQTISDKAIIDGQLPSLDEVAASAVTGGVAGGGVRALHGVPSAVMPDRFSQFSQTDPRLLASVAAELKRQSELVGPIKEKNAGRVVDEARAATLATKAIDAKSGFTSGGDIIKGAVNEAAQAGDVHLPYVYAEMTNDLSRKQPINPDHIATLEDALGGQDPYIDQWLERAKKESVINQLGQMGGREGDAIRGGLHATAPGRTLDKLSKYFGMGALSSGLGASMLGHVALGKVGMAIGAGSNMLNAGVHGIDALTGYSNPVGRFVKRFGDDKPVKSWNPAMAAKAQRENQLAEVKDFGRRSDMTLANLDRVEANDAKVRATAAAALKKQNDAKIKKNKDAFGDTLGRVDKLDALDAAKAQARVDAFQKTIGGIKDVFEPQSQRFGRDMAEPANMPENPGFGASTPVDARKLALDAQFLRKLKLSGEDLAQMNKFDNSEITHPSLIPENDPNKADLIAQWLRHQNGGSDQAQHSNTAAEMAHEQALIDAGIDVRNMGLPDNERFSKAQENWRSRLGTPMEQMFPEPYLIPNAPAYPIPHPPRVDPQANLKTLMENRTVPGPKPKAAPKAEARGSVQLMADAIRSAPETAGEPITRTVGRGKYKVTMDPRKISTNDDGTTNVDAFFTGAENKILRRENFIDSVKELITPKQGEKLDQLMSDHFSKPGMGRDKAFHAYEKAINRMAVSDARKAELLALFKKRGTGLNSLSHWSDR
jgi:hypothetical protein